MPIVAMVIKVQVPEVDPKEMSSVTWFLMEKTRMEGHEVIGGGWYQEQHVDPDVPPQLINLGKEETDA